MIRPVALLLLLCCLVAGAQAVAPVADFAANVTSGIAPLTVAFSDLSTNTPTEWIWSIHAPHSTTDYTDQNPVVALVEPGIYSVVLQATNADGTDTETKVWYIAVRGQPEADFTADPKCGLVPLVIQFTDATTGVPTAWAWNFGDGATSTEQNPGHTYAADGVYSVSLNASNDVGFDIETKADYIAGGVATPVAAFTANVTSGNAPLTIQFTDQSTGGDLTDRYWDFGDGGESTEQNPVHTYVDVGVYEVDLRVDNAYMYDWEDKEDYLVVDDPVGGGLPPVANFTANRTSGLAPLAIQFYDNSTGEPTAWEWTFGDTPVPDSEDRDPVWTFTEPGDYNINLRVSNGDGNDNEARGGYIHVIAGEEIGIAPVANFTANVTSGPAPLTIHFTDLSANDPTSWEWGFDDGPWENAQHPDHTYVNPGVYGVQLTVWNADGSNLSFKGDYITVTAGEVAPLANFTANATSGELPLAVQFTDTSANGPSAWEWDFNNDGTIDSTDQNPVCTFPNAGTYTVVLNASNGAGSNTTTVIDYITVTAGGAVPNSNFTADVTSGTAPLTVAFTDLSDNSPNQWSWVFGDGGWSGDQNPVYTYEQPGTYDVELIARNDLGVGTQAYGAGYITVTGAIPANTTAAPHGFTALSETHGTTWIRWAWSPQVNLSENQTLVGVYDGLEVFNVSANATIPPTMYYRGDLNPNEYHLFGLVLVTNASGNQTTERVDLGVTTAQGAEFFYILFIVALAIALLAVMVNPNRYMALVLLMFAFLLSAYIAVGTTASNASFSVIAIMMAVVTCGGMIFVLYDLVKAHVDWENDDY